MTALLKALTPVSVAVWLTWREGGKRRKDQERKKDGWGEMGWKERKEPKEETEG
jgi:hypothetical protein